MPLSASRPISVFLTEDTDRSKQLRKRGRERWVVLRRLTATCVSGKSGKLLQGAVASASRPTLTTHNVATAIADSEATRSRWISHLGLMPLPPTTFGIFEARFDPGAHNTILWWLSSSYTIMQC